MPFLDELGLEAAKAEVLGEDDLGADLAGRPAGRFAFPTQVPACSPVNPEPYASRDANKKSGWLNRRRRLEVLMAGAR